jgi:hypothetical protein
MEKLKELSFEEVHLIDGGVMANPYSYMPGYEYAVAVKYFFKGLLVGVDVGYEQAPKYEPKH